MQRRVSMNPRVSAYQHQIPTYAPPANGDKYEDLHEGPIHPSQITKNGTALFNFINAIAGNISETEAEEAACAGVSFRGDDRRLGYSFRHSKIHDLERVGRNMETIMNEGHRKREQQAFQSNCIQVNLNDLLNADKAFQNLTTGYNKPVIKNDYKKEEPKTMTDVDISEYLGGGSTQKRTVSQQSNNTFYVNMDKTTKALLAEQVKTNKLLGVLVQSIRENGVKLDELPQHLAEMIAAQNLPDAEIMNEEEYATTISQTQEDLIDETLLP